MVKKMCFVKYVSEVRSSIIELSGGVGTLRNVSAYHEPAWKGVQFMSTSAVLINCKLFM